MDTHLDASGFSGPQLETLAIVVLVAWAACSALLFGLLKRHAGRVLRALCPHTHARTATTALQVTECHWCGERLHVLGDAWMTEDRFRAWVRERP